MSELPCVGAGITVVDPGFNHNTAVFERGRNGHMKPRTVKHRSSRGHLLRAYVTAIDEVSRIYWQCGKRTNYVALADEGVTWARGHGPQARGALLAQRALERTR